MKHQTIQASGAALRPTDSHDIETLRALFEDPGVNEQWGGKPLTVQEITEKYIGQRRPQVQCFLVEEAGIPVGFIQYHLADDGGGGGGIDLVLRPEVRGRGLGSAVVQAIVGHLRIHRGWRRITVDPDVSNPRGVNFWRNVGFENEQLIENDSGRKPYWLMEWSSSDSVASS